MTTPGQPPFELAGRRVFVAGHRGMVGAALQRRLAREDCQCLTAERGELDLRRQAEVEEWMAAARPDAVFVAAATVGGIQVNDSRPAEFLYDNLAIEANLIEAARRTGVKKLLFLGSTCVYPRLAPQPMPEEALLSGPLEPTNQWYAIAKIAGIKLCDAYRRQYGSDFISAMPTNLYGPFDNFDLEEGHVLPALMRRFHEAKLDGRPSVAVWGTGAPKREFLYVEDLADALLFLMRRYSQEGPINVGTGADISIRDLAEALRSVVGYDGALAFDATKPDGAPRKLTDISRLKALGWQAKTDLMTGLKLSYGWFLENIANRAATPRRETIPARAQLR